MSARDPYDPRVTPARGDLAAAALRGHVEADRFVEGKRCVVTAGIADVRRQPRRDASLDTQAIRGEEVTLFDDDEGWGWVQLRADGYVGYVPLHALAAPLVAPTHEVTVNRTFVYPAPDLKCPILDALPLGARVAIDGGEGPYSRLNEGGFLVTAHVAALGTRADDFVAVAEQIIHTPYLWGGKSPLGIDCSGLVQLSLARCGVSAPRDTDMQQAALGIGVPVGSSLAGLRRGDLVFWPGHVGIMRDAWTLVHANAFHMSVASEPLREAVDRILGGGGQAISAIKRL